jgi:hypothetical protein
MASSDPSGGGDEREVLSGLPNARPHRRSAKRDRPARDAPSTQGAPAAAKTRPTPKPPAKPRAKAEPAPPPIPAAGYATPRDDDGPGAVDLIGTTVQAVGELAQIGLAAGGRALKSAFQRLPRP